MITVEDIVNEERIRTPIKRLIEIAVYKKEPVTPYIIEYLNVCDMGYKSMYVLGCMEAKYYNENKGE